MTALLLAYHHGPGHEGWFPFFPLFPLLFLALLLTVFVLVGRRRRPWDRRSAASVLAERYARGEIDDSEYRRRRSVLRGRG
ncbi:MAG TPA: SHOCT domain-containing protein [Acidimicrobiales bacterium]|nr:SHOCT domain-containing protein [Acidimicrobiales bacterium]